MGKVEQLRYPPEIVRGRAFGSEFSDVILARLVSMTKLQLVSLGVALLGLCIIVLSVRAWFVC
jgi:hypothetical protein